MDDDFFVEIGFLAKCLGTTDAEIYQLAKRGMPKVDRKYPFLQCVIWYVGYLKKKLEETESVKARENIRLLKAQADKMELEGQKLKNQLLDAEQIRQQIIFLMQIFKDSLLALPGSLCNDLENHEAKDIRDRLEIEIKVVLNKIGEMIDHEIYEANHIRSGGDGVEDTDV